MLHIQISSDDVDMDEATLIHTQVLIKWLQTNDLIIDLVMKMALLIWTTSIKGTGKLL